MKSLLINFRTWSICWRFAEWLEFLKCGLSIHHGETLQIVFLKILEFELFLHFSRMGYR